MSNKPLSEKIQEAYKNLRELLHELPKTKTRDAAVMALAEGNHWIKVALEDEKKA